MAKELQNYQYLVKYNGSVENVINTGQQIIFVQENEHLINVNTPTQFIAQDENTTEFENVSFPVFDASQQPVYFQLNNSSELIPISVHSLQAVETSNAFQNTILLPNLAVKVIEPENEDKTENMDDDAKKLLGGPAEITVTSEQYEFLKQNGWVLLEINEKVFVLDSTALREITLEYDLIGKLKHETSQIVNKKSHPSRCPVNVTMVPASQNANANNVPKQEVSCVTEPMDEPMEIVTGIERVHKEETPNQVTQDSMDTSIPHLPTQPKVQETDLCNNRKIRIQTQYKLRDIPKEIVLGKSINGKNLIARVIEGKTSIKNTTNINKDMKAEVGRDHTLNDKQFAKLVQQVLLGTAEKCRMEDIASIETVMMQVRQVPHLRADLHKNKLIVTKAILRYNRKETIREENEDGLIQNQSEPAVVTGRCIMNGDEGGFVHIPDMLNTLMNSDSENVHHNYNSINKGTATLDDDLFLHVNITETKDINNVSRFSVVVHKRYVSLSQVYNMKAKHINALYACTACATVFRMYEELKDHQQYHCSSVVPKIHDDPSKLYTVIKARNKIKSYMCKECKANFVKLNDCQEHLRTHYKDTTNDENHHDTSNSKESDVFKCKMCDITYLYSSSLTKHILAKHIMTKY